MMKPITSDQLALDDAERPALQALIEGRNPDPFALLGPQRRGDRWSVRSWQPGARSVTVVAADDRRVLAELDEIEPGFFCGFIDALTPYWLRIDWHGVVQETEDAYAFGPLLGDLDLHLFAQARHRQLSRCLGAQPITLSASAAPPVAGVRFAVWAPNARRVSVIGDFNQWDGRRQPMRLRHAAGIWEVFVPRLTVGAPYQFEIVGADNHIVRKADPFARATLAPPSTLSVVALAPDDFDQSVGWTDQAWLDQRAQRQRDDAPLAIYEVHASSWQRSADGGPLDWEGLADRLIPYARGMGFTHLELLPVTEHPFGGSWGYQPLGMFAPTARLGAPLGFARFVDRAHAAGLGVIIDWVPAHFPSDPHGLARFDGTALYEHNDPREGFHPDWNTLIYNFGRQEVVGFLIASALEWLERYHIDGLRVDAVASMLYRDYSRKPGEWLPNAHGGRENLEAVSFLRTLNCVIDEQHPGAIVIAEESTAWPGVTAPVPDGGLGFDYKWNMGWMHDSLQYLRREPVHRQWHHHELTFGMVYAYSERFVLPLSHDEVVHGKATLLHKMPGDDAQRFAQLRAYYAFMWAHPGKKLLFMGGEIAQRLEWNHDATIDWPLLDQPLHRGVQRLVRDLNQLYVSLPALHQQDCHPEGFRWVVGDDAANSVFAWLRFDRAGGALLAVCNFTPITRHGYRVGVPRAGVWNEVLNTDARVYAGGGQGNCGQLVAETVSSHGLPASLVMTVPGLTAVYWRLA